MIITATDGALTNPLSSTVSVVIRLQDINDNSPKFYQELHRIRISEDLPVNTLIFWLQARDPDSGPNGLIRYSLTDGATDSNRGTQTRFRVDDRTGAIRLSSSLNARIQNRYNITARARDSGKLYSTCFIEIELIPVNRNLHAPYFDEQRTKFEISENAAIASRVGVVSATDEDTTHLEREIRYSIVDGDGLGVFQIDQNTGKVIFYFSTGNVVLIPLNTNNELTHDIAFVLTPRSNHGVIMNRMFMNSTTKWLKKS